MTDPTITPPPGLIKEWMGEFYVYGAPAAPGELTLLIANRAAQWGADQELEACRMEFIDGVGLLYIDETSHRVRLAEDLWNARRPKPPSDKEQALEALSEMEDECLMVTHAATIRRALDQLPDS